MSAGLQDTLITIGSYQMTEDHVGRNSSEQDKSSDKAPNLLQVIGSVLAAFVGVQNKKNKERDFKHGNHRVFIAVGITMTLVFLISVFTVVQLVLAQ